MRKVIRERLGREKDIKDESDLKKLNEKLNEGLRRGKEELHLEELGKMSSVDPEERMEGKYLGYLLDEVIPEKKRFDPMREKWMEEVRKGTISVGEYIKLRRTGREPREIQQAKMSKALEDGIRRKFGSLLEEFQMDLFRGPYRACWILGNRWNEKRIVIVFMENKPTGGGIYSERSRFKNRAVRIGAIVIEWNGNEGELRSILNGVIPARERIPFKEED
jgi:hypothetical protein